MVYNNQPPNIGSKLNRNIGVYLSIHFSSLRSKFTIFLAVYLDNMIGQDF